MKERKLRSKDLLLLLLYVRGPSGEIGEPINGRTFLQKMVFLFEKEIYPKFRGNLPITEEDMPKFEAYRFGPFSKTIMEDIEFLANLGFVEIVAQDEATEPEEAEYEMWKQTADPSGDLDICVNETFKITEQGKGFVKDCILPELTPNQVEAISMLKINCLRVGLKRVLHYVYTKYPDSAVQSEIRNKVLGYGY